MKTFVFSLLFLGVAWAPGVPAQTAPVVPTREAWLEQVLETMPSAALAWLGNPKPFEFVDPAMKSTAHTAQFDAAKDGHFSMDSNGNIQFKGSAVDLMPAPEKLNRQGGVVRWTLRSGDKRLLVQPVGDLKTAFREDTSQPCPGLPYAD